MYCRNCGKELIGTPEICLGCGARPLAGNSFCQACGAATNPQAEICLKCGVRVAKGGELNISPKSRLAATLLAWFLGTFGAHRFYLGKMGTAVVMLVLGIGGWIAYGIGIGGALGMDSGMWLTSEDVLAELLVPLVIAGVFLGAVGIWAFIDFILAVSGNMRDKEGKLIKKW